MNKQKWVISSIIMLISVSMTSCNHRRSHRADNRQRPRTERRTTATNTTGKTVVKMKKENGVYYVPCKINGCEMKFIFDTGASDITMSLTEALFLYKQGKLIDSDFIGTQKYQIADGSIAEGSIVRLHTVEIGNRKLTNVQASIVHNNEAPLLLGQSALAQFGTISIDYNRGEIIFE